MQTPEEFLLVDKPSGMTSHDVVAAVRRQRAIRRVGHAGTLDPGATGLLVVGVGRATRLLQFLVGLDKRYDAVIRLGIATSTEDAEGDVLAKPGLRPPGDLDLAAAISRFRGPILQEPPQVSAIKVLGRPAYDRARRGETVALTARPVTVHELQVLSVTPTVAGRVPVVDVQVRTRVSSGTYIRSLARDLGLALGSAGHLLALRRTGVGPFSVLEAGSLDTLDRGRLSPAEAVGRVLPLAVVPPRRKLDVLHGRPVPVPGGDTGPAALLSASGELLAVAEVVGGRWRYRVVLAPPASPRTVTLWHADH